MAQTRPTSVRASLLLLPLVVCLHATYLHGVGQAQGLPIGIVQIYGNHRVSENDVRKILGVREGGSLPKSKGDIEERLASLDNVVSANLFAACCDEKRTILYVGIEERGSTHFDFNEEPTDDQVTLPIAIGQAYAQFLNAASVAAKAGETGELLSDGHSLMQSAKVRYIQLGFLAMADDNVAILRKVLAQSADPEQRAIAAYVIGYVKDKASVQEDLQKALRDADPTVRANALRALAAFVVYSQKHPEAGLRISPTWLIEMLHSIVWTDRNNAAVALVTLTEGRDGALLDQLRERAIQPIVEMARWKYLPHALPGFILAGRLAGLSEEDLQAAWNKETREPVIKKAVASAKR
ncbi:MAG: HEAT repeat domain-containing protein [Bryobacteraceae bacterium]|nr:HEAT repeat domain-containing protein [Bryobacteraceae bacterium]